MRLIQNNLGWFTCYYLATHIHKFNSQSTICSTFHTVLVISYELRWLSIRKRIDFKIAILTYKIWLHISLQCCLLTFYNTTSIPACSHSGFYPLRYDYLKFSMVLPTSSLQILCIDTKFGWRFLHQDMEWNICHQQSFCCSRLVTFKRRITMSLP